MSEFIKTTSMGIVCPIIKEGDDLKQIVVNSLLQASKDNFEIQDRDVLAITESEPPVDIRKCSITLNKDVKFNSRPDL